LRAGEKPLPAPEVAFDAYKAASIQSGGFFLRKIRLLTSRIGDLNENGWTAGIFQRHVSRGRPKAVTKRSRGRFSRQQHGGPATAPDGITMAVQEQHEPQICAGP
jgi:hypothetical protein